jgi:hypothetical protein
MKSALAKSVFRLILTQKGATSPSTKLWDDWNEERRRSAESLVLQSDLPVSLSLFVPEQTVLLTTQRLVAGRRAIDLSDIIDVKPADFSTKEKGELIELEIITLKGPNFRMSMESGPSYFGF